jgi:hypothetical protein
MKSTAVRIIDAPTLAPSRAEVDYTALLDLSKELVPTGFLPDHIKTPGQAVAIILTGRELGMAPMRALRSLTLVKGKVSENADSQLARFKTDGGRATFSNLDEKGAILCLRHPNGDEHVESFTIEDAKRAGLLANQNWQKYPKAMLRSRVITAGLKSIGWEGGAGAYDPDEITPFTPTSFDSADAAPHGDKGIPPHDPRDDVPDEQPAQRASADKLFPFDGPFKGTPIGTMPLHAIEGYVAWIVKKQNEKEDPTFFAELHEALTEVQAAKREEAEKDQIKMDLEGPQAGDVASSDSPVKKESDLAPTSSGPAHHDDSDDRARWSAARLQKHVLDLLGHPSLNKHLVKTMQDQIAANPTKVQLVQMSVILDEKIMKESQF